MLEEPDTCRICSAPAEPDAPLFHPCKCSGTIRYIHQDCLTTWLAHSKKKNCDVCKYRYSFTKVYSDNMPKQIPFILFLRKLAQKAFWACVLGIRGFMVATIWLAFLPYVTVWTWRFYFIMGENIAWWIYDHPRPNPTPVFHSYFTNLTIAGDQNRTNSSDKTIKGLVTSYPVWRALSADIFTGQIIASLIILVFLGIFLLREWIIQNARPGVFEEDEVFDEEVQDDDEADAELAPIEEALPPPPVEIQHVDEDVQVPVDTHIPAGQSFGDVTPAAQDATEKEASPPRHKRRLDAIEDADEASEHDLRAPRFRTLFGPQEPAGSSEGQEGRGSLMIRRTSEEAVDDELSTDDAKERPSNFKFTFSVEKPAPRSYQPLDTQLRQAPRRILYRQINKRNEVGEEEATAFSFSRPDGADVFQYTPPTELPFPFATNYTVYTARGSSSGSRRPPLPNVDSSTSELLNLNEDAPAFPVFNPYLEPKVAGSSKEPLPSTSLSADQEPDADAASAAARTDCFDDDDSHKSEKESIISSTVATVAESVFREDLDEYFREEDADAAERRGPIRVEELLNGEDVLPDDVDRPVIAEEHPAPADAAEDQDAINDDDVDGALEEAVGMRGPLTAVFQNAALVIFVLDTTIGLAVWLPFTIGKTTALLSLEPVRTVHLLQWPVRVIRYATDPVVDLFTLALFHGARTIMRNFSNTFSDFVSSSADSNGAMHFGSDATWTSKILLDSNFFRALVVASGDGQESAIVRGVNHVANSPIVHFLEPYFARLGRKVRLNAASVKSGWVELANGDASVNRFFAVALGYLLAGLLLAIYLNVLNVGSVQSAGRAIRNAIRQQLIVLKVAVFLVIELAVFPLGCGVMLDFCTLQLFPDASVRSRLSFFAYAPVTATLYHWMVGTMFMYQFAILLGGCRKILRPGGLWFIKDPQDQNFHPIRDILDRPTFVQVRKLAISAMMYSFVVALGMGGLVSCLHFWGRLLLPLRWKLREPLSDIPIDLLFLHIVMPPTIKYFRPRKVTFVLANKYWKWAARQLRITSYMFGGMHSEEMRPSRSLSSWLSSAVGSKKSDGMHSESGNVTFDGSYRRVPAQDNISLPRGIRATIAVDQDGNPLDEAGMRLMDLQDAEAERAKRRIAVDYTVVYLPPHFRGRVIIFITSLWLAGSSLFVASLAIPILLGRAVFGLILNREVHDGYSIILGFYLLWGCYYVGTILDRMDKRRQRSGSDEPRGEYAVYVFKRAMLWAGNVVWVGFWFGIVIPTLLALVIELYLVHPLRVVVNPDLTLNIRIFDSWAIGLVYTKMALSTMRLRPETRIDTALKEMKDNGWRRLNAVAVTLDIIAPVTAGLLAMLLLPILLVLGLQQLLPTKISSNTLCQSPPFALPNIPLLSAAVPYLLRLSCPSIAVLYVYPGVFVSAAFARMYTALQSLCGSWAQQIRDSEFLVEMRLRNLEPLAAKARLKSAVAVKTQDAD